MVHNQQPGPVTRSANDRRRDPWAASKNGCNNDGNSFSSVEQADEMRPRYHMQQPQPQATSKSKEGEDPPSIAVWKDVIASYKVCHESIERSRELRNGRVGREWSGVIERRGQWMTEDLSRIAEALSRNKKLGGKSRVNPAPASCNMRC